LLENHLYFEANLGAFNLDYRVKQANELIIYGIIFWIGLASIIGYLVNKFS